jgi:eukaryotic-like serine/threonine-protein kinase
MSDSPEQKRGATGLDPLEQATTVLKPHAPPQPEAGLEATWPSASRGAAPSEPAPGHILAGRYTVLDFLGQGGMGTVLAAYDSRLDRRVALKLLRQRGVGSSGGDEQSRLVREAQAMARLSHPNVVAVYDSGTLEDGSLFIAMEYVEGQTLRQWCARQPRSWKEILDAYLAAGRGLAAAHAAGLIHRDFKPDNVLVGKEGRVRVMDFGLARVQRTGAAPLQLPAGQAPAAPSPDTVPSPAALTMAGMLMGTPRYMAPELLLQGRSADVRTDVFAFCVSLYEALYGQLPFPGDNLEEVVRAHGTGKARPPPASSEVPTWVARTVMRGLHADPSQRPDSLEEVLAELEGVPDAKRRRRKRAAALAVVLVLGALAARGWGRQQEQASPCEQMERRLAGVWDEPVKARIRAALEATGVAHAPDTHERLATVLDGYAGTWARMQKEVCEAGLQEHASQPRSLTLLQESCLERRRSRLRALTELLARGPDRELVDQAVQAAQALPALEYCADAQALTAAVPPPEEPGLRAQVDALQERVDRLEALYEAGKYREGLAMGEELVKQVEPVPYPPLYARALYVMAELREASNQFDEARALAEQAITAAARGKDALLVARGWSELIFIVGARQGRFEEALRMELALEAAIELADDALARADADNTLGNVLLLLDRYEEARQRHARALALREKLLGPEHPHTTLSMNNLARSLHGLGRYEEARQLLARALARREKVLGTAHPTNAFLLHYLGGALQALGRYEEARQAQEHALALREKAFGPEDPPSASALMGLGNALQALGRYEEARQAQERALAIRERVLGPEHSYVAQALNRLGSVLKDLGRYEEARQRHQRALLLLERALGPTHPRVAASLLGLGELHLVRGRPSEALPLLERALALASIEDRAEVQFALAQALAEAKREPRRARSLAAQAEEHWRSLGHAPNLARVSRWLATHASPD